MAREALIQQLVTESYQHSLDPSVLCFTYETRKESPDGGQGNQMEPDDRLLHIKCYQTAPQACPTDKAEDDGMYYNFTSCGPAVHMQSPLPVSLMKHLGRPTILMTTAMIPTASL